MPGPQRAGEPSGKPLSDVEVQLRGAGNAIVGRAIADSNGAFRIVAPAGQYEVRIDVPRISARCQRKTVQIADGQVAHVDIACDSGMR